MIVNVLYNQSSQRKAKDSGDVGNCPVDHCFLAAPFMIVQLMIADATFYLGTQTFVGAA